MHCRVRYLLNFDLKIRSGQVCIVITQGSAHATLQSTRTTLLSIPFDLSVVSARMWAEVADADILQFK